MVLDVFLKQKTERLKWIMLSCKNNDTFNNLVRILFHHIIHAFA